MFSIPGFTYPVKRHYLEDLQGDYSKTMKMCQQDNPQVIHEDVVQVCGVAFVRQSSLTLVACRSSSTFTTTSPKGPF